jgi:hypothetical protein
MAGGTAVGMNLRHHGFGRCFCVQDFAGGAPMTEAVSEHAGRRFITGMMIAVTAALCAACAQPAAPPFPIQDTIERDARLG